MFAAVRNAGRDILRSSRLAAERRETIFAEFVPTADSRATPQDDLLTAERDEILRLAIDELDDNVREVVVMKVFAGLTFEAIGDVLKEPAKTIATRYRRAIIKLEEKLRGQL